MSTNVRFTDRNRASSCYYGKNRLCQEASAQQLSASSLRYFLGCIIVSGAGTMKDGNMRYEVSDVGRKNNV